MSEYNTSSCSLWLVDWLTCHSLDRSLDFVVVYARQFSDQFVTVVVGHVNASNI